ncbi:MAG: hypothetical protein S4CHLAM2_17390 [Chlamydiales bacterium]|nr:hypothetical protein [Chlamydiales bacterium]
MKALFLTLTLALSCVVQASCPLQIYVGEESYYFWRARDGGTKQEGRIDGVRVGFDRLKRYGWYLGADYLYAAGPLTGKTGRGSSLNSELTDEIFEARFGYTLQKDTCDRPFITPFIGWGCFKETNRFYPPSNLTCKFTDTFNFIAVGFLSGVNLTPLLSMGINFKVRFMQDAQSKVTEDPLFDDVTLQIEDETAYRLEIPFTYTPCHAFLGLGGQVAPFYEFRHFGGREGYPFNFRDTKFHLLGMRLSLVYRY